MNGLFGQLNTRGMESTHFGKHILTPPNFHSRPTNSIGWLLNDVVFIYNFLVKYRLCNLSEIILALFCIIWFMFFNGYFVTTQPQLYLINLQFSSDLSLLLAGTPCLSWWPGATLCSFYNLLGLWIFDQEGTFFFLSHAQCAQVGPILTTFSTLGQIP